MEDGADQLADGSGRPIEWLLMSRKLILGSEYRLSGLQALALRLTKTQGEVSWRVEARTDRQPVWTAIHEGTAEAADLGDRTIGLGKLDGLLGISTSWIQFKVEGCGVASIDLAMDTGTAGSMEESRAVAPIRLPEVERGGWDLFGYRSRERELQF